MGDRGRGWAHRLRAPLALEVVFLLSAVSQGQAPGIAGVGYAGEGAPVDYESWGPPCGPVALEGNRCGCGEGASRAGQATPFIEPAPACALVMGPPPMAAYGAACCDPAVGCSPGLPACPSPCAPPIVWAGGAGALMLFRDDSNHEFFSYDSAIETNQLLDARNAYDDFLPGVQASVARYNLCTMTGWEGVYWGVFPAEQTTYAYAGDVTGDLNAILNFDQLDYNGGPASAYVNDAMVHRLRGSTEIHNAELNRLWGVSPGYGGCSPWRVLALAGFRYVHFSEDLQFAADTVDTMFTGAADELYYTIDVDNNLYGLQLGGTAERSCGGPWSAVFGVKAGVFANDASALSHIGGAAGTAVVNNGPNDGRPWLVAANKCDAAFLAELSAGAARRIAGPWRVVAEYRALAISGVALPTNQIFHDLRGLQDVELLATNGTLLLHGVYVGAELAF